MKKILAVLLTLCLIASMSGCASSVSDVSTNQAAPTSTSASTNEAKASTGTGSESLSLYFLPQMAEEAFWDAVADGVEAAVKDEGNITMTTLADPCGSQSPSKQETYIQTAIDMGADIIAISVLDATTTDAVLQDAMDAGITVVAFDGDPGYDSRNAFVNQTKTTELAKALMDDASDKMKEAGFTADNKGKVAMIGANASTPVQATWIEYLKAYYYSDYEVVFDADGNVDYVTGQKNTRNNTYTPKPEFEHFELLDNPDTGIIDGGSSIAELKIFLTNYLTAHMDTNFVISLSSYTAAPGYEAITELGLEGKCWYGGLAVPTDCVDYLAKGVMTTAIMWQPYDLGYLAVEVAAKVRSGKFDPSSGQKFVSRMSGKDQVAGFQVYDAAGFENNGKTNVVLMGAPAVFPAGYSSAWKDAAYGGYPANK